MDSAWPYAIPPTNPFVNTPGARGEIWAFGFRNPWRFSFDPATGDLYIADVGEDAWEEINHEAAGVGGRNYGWRRMEGQHCFSPSINCDPGGLTLPVMEYSHSLGCSVIGGFRYSGTLLMEHVGAYFFADVCSGRIWTAADGGVGGWSATQRIDTTLSVTTFGENEQNELFLAHYAPSGQLYRIVSSDTAHPVLSVSTAGAGAGRVTSSPTALDCGSICAVEFAGATSLTLSATADAGSTFVGWSGDADCADGMVSVSSDSACTARFAIAFTDDELVAGSTVIKAVHITELRSRIDALRASASLAAFDWTNPTLAAGSTVIRAIHVSELRAALNEAYYAMEQTAPTYTDATLIANSTTVKAVHITEIRSAVIALE